MKNSINYSYEQLKRFCEDAFPKFGYNEEDAKIITDVLLLADLYGTTTDYILGRTNTKKAK